MNFSRIFASALARRIAVVIVAGVLAFFGIGSARAQTPLYPDQGSALAACNASMQAQKKHDPGAGIRTGSCVTVSPYTATISSYFCRTVASGGSPCIGGGIFYFGKENTCDKRPDWNGPYPYLSGGTPRNGSVTCNDGCKQAWYSTGDGYFNGKYTSVAGTCDSYDDNKCKAEFGTGYYWNGAMSSCEPEEGKCTGGAKPNSLGECKPEPCPEGKVQNADGTCENKKNECPAGNVKAPSGECLPGDGQCAAGEAKGKDGTCKRDSNGDGKPDSEEGEDDPNKDSASGGENCNAPPSCNGNPIMCLQLRTQWRIDCNTRKDHNVTGGACSAMPVCVGKDCNAQAHAQLIQQWKASCALEKLASKSGDDGGQPDWTKVSGDGTEGVGAEPEKPHRKVSLGTGRLDDGGFLGGSRSCPQFPVADMGRWGVWDPNKYPYFCDFVALVRWTLVLLGAFIAFRIMAGS